MARQEKIKVKQSQIDLDDEFLSFKEEPKPKRVSIQASVQVRSKSMSPEESVILDILETIGNRRRKRRR